MTLFVLIWIVLVGAAAGLAVGALRGRELQKGSCGGRGAAADGSLPACLACASTDATSHRATRGGG